MVVDREHGGIENLRPTVDALFTRLEKLRHRASRLGVDARVLVHADGYTTSHESRESVFAASVGKLPVACMAVDMLDPDEELELSRDDILPGRGTFDSEACLGDPRSAPTVVHLLEDMLRNSGNTAYRLLARRLEGPDSLQAFVQLQGWTGTRVATDDRTGNAQIGVVSAEDAIAQLRRLLDDDRPDVMSSTARLSLASSTVHDHGIRQHVGTRSGVNVFNKTGEYNGDRDDPYAFRHDVGRIQSEDHQIDYVLLTTSPMRARGIVADQYIARVTAELAAYAGASLVIPVGFLGLRASR